MKVILASASQRRRELLEKLGISFTVKISGCDEDCDISDPNERVMELSARKAAAVAEALREETDKEDDSENILILGADTVVVSNGQILGKPTDKNDAFRMIKGYCEKTHKVLTGVTLIDKKSGRKNTFVSETAVTVSFMTDEEIRAYVDTGEPMDKAGAYGIQGLFAPYVERIDGEYSNVVGLPIAALRKAVKEFETEEVSD